MTTPTPRAGDTVHVKATVVAVNPDFTFFVRPNSTAMMIACKTSDIEHVEPRPLKVGERVRLGGGGCHSGEIIIIDGDQAGVRWDAGFPKREFYALTSLTPAD